MISSVDIKNSYPKYIKLIKDSAKKITKELGTKVFIEPTSLKLCKSIGINNEAANGLNTIEFIKSVYSLLKNKGYQIPKILISEDQIPRNRNLAGIQLGNWNIFGPGNLATCGPSVFIHECGHFLHNKNMPWNQPLYSMFCSFRNIFRPFLNKNEKEILTNDYKRAYSEGYFKDLEIANCIKKGLINKETFKNFYKSPEKYLVKNAFFNVSEFIAEYFTLASKGFQFSPEINKRYKAFHGPEIKKIITSKEINDLLKLKKSLEKRSIVNI